MIRPSDFVTKAFAVDGMPSVDSPSVELLPASRALVNIEGWSYSIAAMRLLATILWFRVCCNFLCVSTCAACCAAQARLPGQSPQRLFDFHSGFWINLHHFRYRRTLSSVRKTGMRPLFGN